MNTDILEQIEIIKTRFNKEIARAVRTQDTKALQKASEIKAEISGFRTALLILEHRQEAEEIRIWLNSFYD